MTAAAAVVGARVASARRATTSGREGAWGRARVNGAPRRSPAGDRVCDLPEARAELKRVLGDARRSKIAVEELTVPRGSVYVLGDCADVSVDSRVWGPLRTSEIRARPLNTLKGRR